MAIRNPYFALAKMKAGRIANDSGRIARLLQQALAKAKASRGALDRVWNDFTVMLRLVKTWAIGGYRDIPWRTIVLVIAGIVYFVNPFDLIPDWLPGIGLIDDATVLAFIASSVREDLRRFCAWEQDTRDKPKRQ